MAEHEFPSQSPPLSRLGLSKAKALLCILMPSISRYTISSCLITLYRRASTSLPPLLFSWPTGVPRNGFPQRVDSWIRLLKASADSKFSSSSSTTCSTSREWFTFLISPSSSCSAACSLSGDSAMGDNIRNDVYVRYPPLPTPKIFNMIL